LHNNSILIATKGESDLMQKMTTTMQKLERNIENSYSLFQNVNNNDGDDDLLLLLKLLGSDEPTFSLPIQNNAQGQSSINPAIMTPSYSSINPSLLQSNLNSIFQSK
jgi:hypothetical protein